MGLEVLITVCLGVAVIIINEVTMRRECRQADRENEAEMFAVYRDELVAMLNQPPLPVAEPELPEDSWSEVGLESTSAMIARIDHELWLAAATYQELVPDPGNREVIETRREGSSIVTKTYGKLIA